jgi:hypothetical protein
MMDIKPVLVVERVDEQTGEKVWQEARPSAYLEIPEADRLRLNLFRLIDGAYTPEEIGRIHSLPRFEITAFAQDIPKELLSLPPCSEVVLRSSSSDDVMTVENAIQKFRRIISPPDRLTVFEAVGLLERYGIQPPPTGKTHGPFRIDPLQWLCREVEAGRLVFNDHGGLRIEPGEYAGHFGLYGETTSRKELNAWLERIGHLCSIPAPVAPSVAVAAPTTAPSASVPAVADHEPLARPAEAVPVQEAGATKHRIKSRIHPLDGVIAEARKRAVGGDWMTVWNVLCGMAEARDRPEPLLGYSPVDGLKYRAETDEGFEFHHRESFRKRWATVAKG